MGRSWSGHSRRRVAALDLSYSWTQLDRYGGNPKDSHAGDSRSLSMGPSSFLRFGGAVHTGQFPGRLKLVYSLDWCARPSAACRAYTQGRRESAEAVWG